MIDGGYMRNDSLKPEFTCGQKENDTVDEFYLSMKNPKIKTIDEEITELKERIVELESKLSSEVVIPK
jgi:hypothetical protein